MARKSAEVQSAEAQTEHATEGQDRVSGAAASASTAVAVNSSTGFLQVDGVQVKLRRRVTIPVLPFQNGMTIICRILDAIHDGKEVKVGSRGPKMGKARLVTIEATTGMQRTLVVGTVLEAELEENYPNDTYVGAWFAITKIAPNVQREKDYATYEIIEIDPPEQAKPKWDYADLEAVVEAI